MGVARRRRVSWVECEGEIECEWRLRSLVSWGDFGEGVDWGGWAYRRTSLGSPWFE